MVRLVGAVQHSINEETFDTERKKRKMNLVNPKYVPRNYMAQLCIDD
jgi:uncharacterized protein YdiU (UPF0061 family)